MALGRDAAQAVVAHQSLLSVGLSTRPDEQLCAGRRVLDGPGEGPVEDQVEGVHRHRDGAHRHRGGGGGARAGLVDVDAGALQDAAERLVARADRSASLEVAAGLERRPSRARSAAPSRADSVREARQLDGALPARPLDVAPLAEHRHEAQVARRAYGSRIASSPCSKAPSTPHHRPPRPRPRTAPGACPRTACAHFASRYSASVITAISSSLRSLEDPRDHAVRLLVRPRVDRGRGRAGRCPASASVPAA